MGTGVGGEEKNNGNRRVIGAGEKGEGMLG